MNIIWKIGAGQERTQTNKGQVKNKTQNDSQSQEANQYDGGHP